MKKRKLLLTIVTPFLTLFWQNSAHAFLVTCYPGQGGGESTLVCETSWGPSDVAAYNNGVVDTIGVTAPPYEFHSGQLVAAAAIVIPSIIVHYLANRPINAFYILSQKSIFSGVYMCFASPGEPAPFPFSHIGLDDEGKYLDAGGSGGLIGQGN